MIQPPTRQSTDSLPSCEVLSCLGRLCCCAGSGRYRTGKRGGNAKAKCASYHPGMGEGGCACGAVAAFIMCFEDMAPSFCKVLSQRKGLSCFAGMPAEADPYLAPVQPRTRCCACSTAWLWSGWSTGSQTRPRRAGWLPRWLATQHRQASPFGLVNSARPCAFRPELPSFCAIL